jgi:hypothetical protein
MDEKKNLKNTQKQIDKSYKEAQKMYDTQAAQLAQLQPQYEQTIVQGYESQVPMLQQQAKFGMENIGLQKEQAGQQRETALSSARRQYEQGLQRTQQLFGGVAGSNVGQASSDILAAEQMRQLGSTQAQSAQTFQQLGSQERDIQVNLTNALQQLEVRKQQDLMKLRDSFRQELNQINAQRGALSLNKANAQLQALQDYNARKRQLEDLTSQRKYDMESYAQKLRLSNQYNTANQVAAVPNLANKNSQQIADEIVNLRNTDAGLRALNAAGWTKSNIGLGGKEIWSNQRSGYTLDLSGVRLGDKALDKFSDLPKEEQTLKNLYNIDEYTKIK